MISPFTQYIIQWYAFLIKEMEIRQINYGEIDRSKTFPKSPKLDSVKVRFGYSL